MWLCVNCAALLTTHICVKDIASKRINRECLHNVFKAVILAELSDVRRKRLDWFYRCLRERKNWGIYPSLLTVWTVLSIQKLLQKCAIFTSTGFSTISHVIRIISSTNCFRQSPQLKKTTMLEQANTIGCSQNVPVVSLTLILFIDLFILTWLSMKLYFNIFVLRSVNILLTKWICVCVCVAACMSPICQSHAGGKPMQFL